MYQMKPKSRWPNVVKSSSFVFILITLVLVSEIESIVVKQSSQSQQQQQQQQSSQQQRSDDSSQSSQSQPQQQSQSSPSSSSASSSSSSSSSSASAANGAQLGQMSGVQPGGHQHSQYSNQHNNHQISSNMNNISPSSSSVSSSMQQASSSSRASDSAHLYPSYQASNQKANSYADQLASASSNPEHSYQAAASSVNMALANSGIFGSSYAPQSGSTGTAGSAQQASQMNSQQLNPLHYYYYPAKEASGSSGANSQANSMAPKQTSDGSAGQSYQPMTYSSYADQLSSALSSLGANQDMAASSQDASYLPQPVDSSSYANQQPQSQSQPQQHQQQPQQSAPGNQHQQSYGDLSAYNSMNQVQQQQPNSQQANQAPQHQTVSFNGPTATGSAGDYLNSHLGSHQGASSMYNQPNGLFGDLAGAQAGYGSGNSLSAYLSSGQGQPGNQHQTGQDLQSSSSLLGQQFSSAPSSVPGASQQQAGASGLFGSSMFGPAGQAAGASSILGSQAPFGSFLTAQQYSQLTGQPLPTMDSQQPHPLAAAASSPTSSITSSGSSKRFGISSFIMPMLALAGLSLLIPTMSNIGTAVGRRKRSVEDKASASNRQQQILYEPLSGSAANQMAKEHSIGEYMDKIERYYSIYKNAVENDDCLNRLICEFGDAVKDITGKSAIVTVIEKLVPNWMTGKMHLFKEAALDNKEGREKCKKYICHSNKHH